MRLSASAALALLLCAASPAASWAQGASPGHRGHPSMGTVLHCEWAPLERDEGRSQRALESALVEVDKVEAALSHYRPESELRRFNALPGGSSWNPSPTFEEVFLRAEGWRSRTSGAFSCRLQPWLSHRGFIPGTQRGGPPDLAEQELASPSSVTHEPGVLFKHLAGAGLDFDGIAKGYALDLAAERLAGKVAWAYLSYGSSGVLVGEGGARALAIPDPRRSGPDAPTAVAVWLRAGSFSTSSCSENRRRGACHIVDPRTLHPAGSSLLSATAVSASATDADALSTASMVLGPEGARDLALRCGAEVVLITSEPFPGAVAWRGLWVYVSEGLRPWSEVAP